MTSSRTGEFRRCTAACPCQVCGRQKYCMVTEAGDYALCTKEESDYRIEKLDGWRHFIPAKNRLARSLVRKHTASALSNKEFVDFTALHQRYTERMTTDARILVADGLGVSVEALEQFDLGFCAFPAALVIPAMAGEHQIVGLRHRRTNPSASVGKWHCEIGSTASKDPGRIWDAAHRYGRTVGLFGRHRNRIVCLRKVVETAGCCQGSRDHRLCNESSSIRVHRCWGQRCLGWGRNFGN